MQKYKAGLKKLSSITYHILLAILILVTVFSLSVRVYNNAKGGPPTVFGYTPTIVVSGSMLPTLQIGSLNIIKPCGIDDVKVGDIVVYWSDVKQLNIIHRIVDKYTTNTGLEVIETKGDNNGSRDPWVTGDTNIVGKVVFTCNVIAPFLKSVMSPNSVGIDYLKFAEYSLLLIILLWGLETLVYTVIYYIVRLCRRHNKSAVEETVDQPEIDETINETNDGGKVDNGLQE